MPRPDRAFRTHAIILKRRDFNESDRLLTLMTPTHGKIDVIAKGARKPTSSKAGHVELFTRADMLIHTGRDFGILQQAEMIAPYLPLREDLTRGAYAGYAAELVDRFTGMDDDDHQARVYRLLDDTLNRLCADEDPRRVMRYFEVHLLGLVGFRPEMNECLVGHEPVMPEDQYFSYVEGGIICTRHALKNTVLTPISMNALKLLRHMQRSGYTPISKLTISPALHEEVERVMLGYITYQLERRLQSIDFLRLVRT